MDEAQDSVYRLSDRTIAIPAHLSEQAQAFLVPRNLPAEVYPDLDDKAAWRALVSRRDGDLLPLFASMASGRVRSAERRDMAGVSVYDIIPEEREGGDDTIVLDFHGGALIFGGGELCRLSGSGLASRLRRRLIAVDYRMPPDHPYPAGLDDGIAVYRALLEGHGADRIIVAGGSAGGNLAAALVLRARDEGLPLPAGVILSTPEIDLTESGDSFHTLLGIDPALRSLMPVNLLYADGHDLAHPYLSPLFGDFSKGFAPTILTTGTRDLFLSNTVRMHRALRAANIPAELHIVEAGGHGNFPGAPENLAIELELRRFVIACLGEGA